jgi:hypothetical protein
MSIPKMLSLFVVLSIFVFGISAVGAQDATVEPRADRIGPLRSVINIVAGEIGLEPRDILVQLRNGFTLADIITTNGGDVDQVIADSLVQLTDQINQAVADGKLAQERADNLLTNLEDVVTRGINGELFPNRLDRGAVGRASERILIQAVADVTKLRTPQILQQLHSGSTLADIITTNGATVDTVITNAVAAATEQVNAAVADGSLSQEQADQLIANLPDLYTAAVNGELRQELLENRVGRGVLTLAAEQTGLERAQIVQELQSGKSLADVLTEHDVDVTAFIDTAVSQATERANTAVNNGRITQEQANQLISTFRERLTQRINQSDPSNTESTPAV